MKCVTSQPIKGVWQKEILGKEDNGQRHGREKEFDMWARTSRVST